ncbi:MAG: hypothetical protein JNJ77_04895 [Planctomycetia bacterium]|nr:hypothetical protein [Planctomycetia bacterium]
MEDDVFVKGRWYLNGLYDGAGIELDSRYFSYGRPIEIGPPLRVSLAHEYRTIEVSQPLKVTLSRVGKPLDLTFAAFDMPVATIKTATLLASIADADVQRIPTQIESQTDEFEIINAISCIDCIDTQKSEIQWYEEGNEVRPDLAGSPEMITKIIIDPDRVSGHHIFRPKGWVVAVIVSDVIKQALESSNVSRVMFSAV